MFHTGMWRERLRNALTNMSDGTDYERPPDTVDELRAADAPRLVLGAALYNLACLRARENRVDDVLSLLKEAFPMRPDLKAAAAEDSDLGAVRNDARFQDLLKP